MPLFQHISHISSLLDTVCTWWHWLMVAAWSQHTGCWDEVSGCPHCLSPSGPSDSRWIASGQRSPLSPQTVCNDQTSCNTDHQFHNLLCLKQNLTWANVLSLSLQLWSGMNSPSLWKRLKLQLFSPKKNIYSKLHFHHKSSVVARSDNDFCASLFTIMLNYSVLLCLWAQIPENTAP